MAADRETAFVLPASAANGTDSPVHFANFPGVYYPDQPVAVSELGFETLTAARDAKRELAPDLKETKVDAGSGLMPERENHVPFPAADEPTEPVSEETPPPEPPGDAE